MKKLLLISILFLSGCTCISYTQINADKSCTKIRHCKTGNTAIEGIDCELPNGVKLKVGKSENKELESVKTALETATKVIVNKGI